nr:CD1247 N-terminal domain-containing protein [uncultured Gemmiger sp.]
MAMDLNAKAAYIRGLMTGMEFDPNSKNGKIIAAMMDLLEAMADTVTEHDQALDQAFDELDAIDEDLDDLTDALFGTDDEDDTDADDDAEYEVTCPNCGAVTAVDEDTLLNQELVCPNCGAAFDIELAPEEGEESDPSTEE